MNLTKKVTEKGKTKTIKKRNKKHSVAYNIIKNKKSGAIIKK